MKYSFLTRILNSISYNYYLTIIIGIEKTDIKGILIFIVILFIYTIIVTNYSVLNPVIR